MIVELTKENLKQFELSILSETQIKKEFDINPFARYYIYVEENAVIGYIYYSDIYDRIEINQIEVDINHRNKGIGTKLMKQLTEAVDKSITLEVKEDNYIAIRLYNNFGFQKVAIRKGYYGNIDGILMERKI